ncbi:3'-5' exoribonuclease [Vibrio cholerae]|nr:3'-5' exoribonuclease [Vibrio cholerae]
MTKVNTSVFDTETTGTDNKCIILTLSAVKFDRFNAFHDSAELKNYSFHRTLSVPEQILKGRIIEASCIEQFWLKQPQNVIDEAFFASATPVKQALEEFFDFIKGTQLYCRGTDFDPPKLASLCNDFGVQMPIKYNKFRDVRTYIDAFTMGDDGYIPDWETPNWITPHISVDDCWRDALQMIEAPIQYNKL